MLASARVSGRRSLKAGLRRLLVLLSLVGLGVDGAGLTGSIAREPRGFEASVSAQPLPAGAVHTTYLPVVTTDPPAPCQPIAGLSYSALTVTPESFGAAMNPDLNLSLRGYQPTNAPLALVTYGGRVDPSAPQLLGLFADSLRPTFSAAYQVHDWDWVNMRPGPLLTTWPVTVVGLATTPGATIHAPGAALDIGSGYVALVLYAEARRLTLKYTRNDDVRVGYTIHLEDICTSPDLLALYQSLDAAGRGSLPALRPGQAIGRAQGAEVDVAIRDSGTFMDPRSRLDWWAGL
jgi:hypothetical protein